MLWFGDGGGVGVCGQGGLGCVDRGVLGGHSCLGATMPLALVFNAISTCP